MSKKSRISINAGVVIGIVVLGLGSLGLLSFFEQGYRIQGLSITKPATVELKNLPENATVFLDNRRKAHSETPMETITLHNIAATVHDVLVAKDGYWPWSKSISLSEGQEESLAPFLIPQRFTAEIVKTDASDYQLISRAFNHALPNEAHPLVSQSGNVKTWISDERSIVAQWVGSESPPTYYCHIGGSCTEPIIVLDAVSPISAITFFPDRDDVLAITLDSGVFAIEIDTRQTQNFQPLWKTSVPVTLFDGSLYLRLSDKVVRLAL